MLLIRSVSRTATWTWNPSLRNEPGKGGRSLGEHGTYRTNPCAFALEDRDSDLDEHAVEPVRVAGSSGPRSTADAGI
jgi:hypothetical protein